MIEAYVRKLVGEGWREGHPGRGLLAREPERLLTCRQLSPTAGPHHADIVNACELSRDDVVAYLEIFADGSFTVVGGGSSDTVTASVSALDPRLWPAPPRSWEQVFDSRGEPE